MFLLLLLLLLPTLALAQAPCSHWASPQGTGSSCTQAQPCKVSSFWPLAGPGKTLCLRDGTYMGEASMIRPPRGLNGTQANPITVRAEHDGQALLDAQHAGNAVWLGWHDGVGPNDWFVIEGINAKNGMDAIFKVSSSNAVVRRVIGWDGTTRAQNAFAFDINGYGSRAEDCAGWGMNLRKIFNASQVGDMQGGGFRRCWGEWNDHTEGESDPNNTYQAGYGSRNQLFENVLGTQNTLGQSGGHEGVFTLFCGGCNPQSSSVAPTRVLGGIWYITAGSTYSPNTLLFSTEVSDATLKDIAMIVPPGYPTKHPFYHVASACAGVGCRNNTCTNCLAVHDGAPGRTDQGSGWTMPQLREGKGLAQATGGESPFNLLPGICYRYENGELTTKPLWPFPMNQRIKDARVASGATPVDVTQTIETLLGPIPAACRTGVPPGPVADLVPPTATITAPSHEALVSGTAVAVSARGQDNVGVVAIRFELDGVPVGDEQSGENVYVLADSTTVANGLHKFRAIARDAAGNESVGGTIDITIFNAPPVPPPVAHVPLRCSGEVLAGGRVELACVPQEGRR